MVFVAQSPPDFGRLEAEKALDLVPDRQAEDDGHEREHDEDDVEAEPCLACAPAVLDAGAPLCAVEAVRVVDRFGGIDGRRLGRRLRANAWFRPGHWRKSSAVAILPPRGHGRRHATRAR